MSDRFDELVGPVEDADERARLRRVHDLLLVADPPPAPARPPRTAGKPTRPLYVLLAAALAAAAFGSGWLLGDRSDDVAPAFEVAMAGPDAEATIEVLPQDASGNWPMRLLVRGLAPSTDRDDSYELWLTRDGELADSCGVFTVHPGRTIVTLSVPFALRSYDGWVVTRRGSDAVLLTT